MSSDTDKVFLAIIVAGVITIAVLFGLASRYANDNDVIEDPINQFDNDFALFECRNLHAEGLLGEASFIDCVSLLRWSGPNPYPAP